MYLQFGIALLDGGIRETRNHFAKLCSLLIEELLCFSPGSEGLFDFALASTSNLLELVNELPFLFAVVGGEGVTQLRSLSCPVHRTEIILFHYLLFLVSPWTRVIILTGLSQYLLGVLSDPGHLGFRPLIYLASISSNISHPSSPTLSLLPAFPTCSSRSLMGSNLSRWFLWWHLHRRVVNELSAFSCHRGRTPPSESNTMACQRFIWVPDKYKKVAP